MSEVASVHCAGAPRDLGLDQGLAARAAVAQAARALRSRGARALRADRALARSQRDALRHFPHHAERALGLALGARIPDAAALSLQAACADEGAALAARDVSGAPLLGRAVGPHAFVEEPALWLRTSAPDTDFRSLELVWAWGAAALVGVNEHGVAVSACAPEGEGASTALLFAQDVLQRFDAVEKAVDWIARRPSQGAASFVIADARGALARVEVAGADRRATDASGERHDAVSLLAALRRAQPRARVCAVADPANRRLGVARDGGALVWTALEATRP